MLCYIETPNGNADNKEAAVDHGIDFVEIGARIVAARRRLGLKQYELAKQTDLHPVTISRLEHGQMPGVTVEVLARIAKALHMPLHELLRWEEAESESFAAVAS